jgi:hypothetical protein
MATKTTLTRLAALLAIATTLAFSACSSTPKQTSAPTNADLSKAIAKIIAKNASAPLAFKDQGSANGVTASIAETSALKFALVLDRDLNQFSQYFAAPFDRDTQPITETIQKRIRSGATEFTFTLDNLAVTVVPIREANQLQGYAAVGAL